MTTHADKTQNTKSQQTSNVSAKSQGVQELGLQLVDKGRETTAQRKLQEMANQSPQVKQLRVFQEIANNHPKENNAVQFQEIADNYSSQKSPFQKKENNTGLPDNLKSGIENLSGYSMDDVKVHYNSEKPAQLQAHAYAQGTDIHLASGQEKHLPHEAWHVVQQKQGRVKPTLQMKGKVKVNDEEELENEAEAKGREALQIPVSSYQTYTQPEAEPKENIDVSAIRDELVQRSIIVTKEGYRYDNTEEAYEALKSSFGSIPEVDLKVILAKLNSENAQYQDFRNLKFHIQQLAEKPQEQDLSESPDLWMKSGGLDKLQDKMDGQVQLWPQLSEDLVQYCQDNPQEVEKAGDILDCGKLTLPLDLNISAGDFSPGLAVVPDPLRERLGAFLVSFMKANGQLPYIQSKEWFKSGSHKVVIEINFYPARGFDEVSNTLGVHKDTDSRNLFVNLIFNNPTAMPGTEWTMDELSPDDTRMAELYARLPEEEMINILAAKKRMENLPGDTPGRNNWEGGTVGANSYVSWVDELIWHSTPAMGKRPRYDKDQVNGWFETDPTGFEKHFYEAMLTVSENAHGNIRDYLDWFKTSLKDESTWLDAAEKLRTESEDDWIKAFNEIHAEIQAVDWGNQKATGRAGRVEVDIGKGAITDNRTVPTSAGGRPRSNSVDNSVIAKNQEALLEMKGGNPHADLPMRSFIRTWVTLVKV